MDDLICAGLRAGVETLRRPDGYLSKDEMIDFLYEYVGEWEFSSTEREGVRYDYDALCDYLGPDNLGKACEDVDISDMILLSCADPEAVIESCIGSVEGLVTSSNFASAGMGGGDVSGYSAVKRGDWFAVYYDGDGEAGERRYWLEEKTLLSDDPKLEATAKSAKEALGLYDWFDVQDPDDAYLVALFADRDFAFNLREALTVGDELLRGAGASTRISPGIWGSSRRTRSTSCTISSRSRATPGLPSSA
ncbi:MAG: hypothetical protein M5T61_03165 [Acidimicrobiia bacterium]|nr:hypothetical protein [Acidimicrobiia bacterium]